MRINKPVWNLNVSFNFFFQVHLGEKNSTETVLVSLIVGFSLAVDKISDVCCNFLDQSVVFDTHGPWL